jgi:gliding motility-associated-like protein
MKINKLFTGILALVLFSGVKIAQAQLTVNNNTYVTPNPAQSLVNNVLLGAGVTASNITYTSLANPGAHLGFFNGTNSNLGLDSGIVISTGNVLNNMPGALFPDIDSITPGVYPDLLNVANSVPPLIGQTFSVSNVYDVAVLEFDFVPVADSVKFRYVFGSNEYLTWINSSYNDVFGFFISGPGINGPYAGNSQNIAVVPNSNPALPITISSVQPNLNGQYFIDNANNSTVQLNGFTSVFTASSPVTCGQTYHIRLAIADGSDWTLESSVFLEALSFTSNAVSVLPTTVSGDSTIVEGCSQGGFSFYRPGSTDSTLVVPVNLSGTAIEGVDYNFLPDSVTFAPGVSTVVVPVIPFSDALTEGPESISISFTQDICGSIVITTSLWIVPITPIVSFAEDTTIACPGETITLPAQFSGGYAPYTVVWSTGDTAGSITVNPTVTTTYYYTVNDTCFGVPVNDSITVTVPNYIPLSVVGTPTDICVAEFFQDTLFAVGAGGTPPYDYTWYFNGFLDNFGPQNIFTAYNDGIFVVEMTDVCGVLIAVDSINLTVGYPTTMNVVTLGANQSIVEGCGQGIFQFTRGGLGLDSLVLPITISGSATMGTDFNNINDTVIFVPGINMVEVSVAAILDGITETDETIVISFDQVGCAAPAPVRDSINIVLIEPIVTNAPSNYNISCPGDNITLNSSFLGGYPPYDITWSTGDIGNSITVNPAVTTTYTFTVSDSCSSLPATQSVTVTVPSAPALSSTVLISNEIKCPGETSVLTATPSGGFPSYTYLWTLNGNPVSNTPSFTTPTLAQTTTYVLSIDDICSTGPYTQNVTVNVNPYLPISLNLGDDITLTCPDIDFELQPVFSNGLRPYTFSWSTGLTVLAGDSTAIAQPSVNTTYSLSMTDACAQTAVVDQINVTVASYSALTANASSDTTVCPGNPITLSVIADGGAGNYTYLWEDLVSMVAFDGNTQVSISPTIDNTVTYRITVTDLCGTTAIDEVNVPLRQDCDVISPNFITPNGDGENQFLVFENIELFPQPKLEVFNRWGTRVFQSDNYQNNWAPTDLNPGVYYFTLELGTIEAKKGFFQLMK